MSFEVLNIHDIQLDLKNPRIAQLLERFNEPTAEQVAFALNDGEDSYGTLKESIRVNNGIFQPIIVNRIDKEFVVIEGNTRLLIYKELLEETQDSHWQTIIAVVHDNLTDEAIDAIRLQAHMVGPRDWDPYSKAKYLNFLSNQQYLSMNEIISFCGGDRKKSEIKKMIAAYNEMQKHFVPKLNGNDIPHQKFSAFVELQNKNIKEAIIYNNFTLDDFADWVLNGNIDKMANVRNLKEILPDEKARAVFLKSNCTEAMKLIEVPGLADGLLKDASIVQLAKRLKSELDHIEYAAIKDMAAERDEIFTAQKDALYALYEVTGTIIEAVEKENE